jgi:hypothetical protein
MLRKYFSLPTLVVFLIGYSSLAASAFELSECIENGGERVCLKPHASAWQYSVADSLSELTIYYRARCIARGGTWQGPYGNPPCPNDQPFTEGNLTSYAGKLYEEVLQGDNGCTATGTA